MLNGKEPLAHLYLARPMTGWTRLRAGTRFCATAMTHIALFQRWDADLFGYTTNCFFQRQIHVVTQVCAARGTRTTATAKDIAKACVQARTMRTLKADALAKVARGLTTLEEAAGQVMI